MAIKKNKRNSLYGYPAPTSFAFPAPLKLNRNPNPSDYGEIGQVAVNQLTGIPFMVTEIVGGQYIWTQLGGAGTAGSFTTLTSSGATTLATTGASVNTFGNNTGATSVAIEVGTGGFNLGGVAGSSITIGTGVTTGAIAIGAAQTSGPLSIGGTAGTGTVSLGFSSVANTILIGNGIGASSVDIVAGTGGLELQAPRILLGASGALINVYTGAGVPSNGLALAAGDLYVNKTPTGATDRMFIATGVGAWTNFTTAA
jgi:hypothetical protein